MALGTSLASDLETVFSNFSINGEVILTPSVAADSLTYSLTITVNDDDFVEASYTATVPSDNEQTICEAIKVDIDAVSDVTDHITATVVGTGSEATLEIAANSGSDEYTLSAITEFTQLLRTTHPEDIATAIDTYLSGGVYAAGNFTFSSGMVVDDLILPTEGTVSYAADKWSTALENYFSSGSTTPAAGIEAEAITYTAVKSTLEASLTTVFTNINNTAAQQATSIANAIAAAVATISATYTITSGPTIVLVPAPAIL